MALLFNLDILVIKFTHPVDQFNFLLIKFTHVVFIWWISYSNHGSRPKRGTERVILLRLGLLIKQPVPQNP